MTGSYPGGKAGAGVYQAIINQMPPHDTYIEPFLGAGAVIRRKRPAAQNIGIDADPVAIIAAFGDAAGAIAVSGEVGRQPGGIAISAGAAASPASIAICGDGIQFLIDRERWTGRELVYCDPPYLLSARRSPRRLYAHEMMAEADHLRLLSTLKRLPCMVMVSGYASPLYARELAGWRLVTFTAATRGRPATEHLWCNFPEPAALHDYRFLGADFRERERIGRKARRWAVRLAGLAPLERQAVLSACLSPSTIANSGDARAKRTIVAERKALG